MRLTRTDESGKFPLLINTNIYGDDGRRICIGFSPDSDTRAVDDAFIGAGVWSVIDRTVDMAKFVCEHFDTILSGSDISRSIYDMDGSQWFGDVNLNEYFSTLAGMLSNIELEEKIDSLEG